MSSFSLTFDRIYFIFKSNTFIEIFQNMQELGKERLEEEQPSSETSKYEKDQDFKTLSPVIFWPQSGDRCPSKKPFNAVTSYVILAVPPPQTQIMLF